VRKQREFNEQNDLNRNASTGINTKSGSAYRYPGSSPFSDSRHDRELFFGREEEAQYLFHSILVENLFVLFARSGIGKTSLINAGLKEQLRQKDFFPMVLRFNTLNQNPLEVVYAGIEESVAQWNRNNENAENPVDLDAGDRDSLWHYFKTTSIWSREDKRLTPVLILDQFEEFFIMHSRDSRQEFIRQLGDLLSGRVPRERRKQRSKKEENDSFDSFYSKCAPTVKIIISIREDYLGHLQELNADIPAILKNRYRLLPLQCARARAAIIEPARIEGNGYFSTRTFTFADEAIDEMLGFLCEQKRLGVTVKTHEVDPCQLQLLCQHIEEMVLAKKTVGPNGYMVKKNDLGGRAGMEEILRGFYEERLKALTPKEKRNVRKLCENGLIQGNYRMSLEIKQIEKKYRVSQDILNQLVENRLLRVEPRVGSFYYELSHDTLVEPILESEKQRKKRLNWIFLPLVLIISVLVGLEIRTYLVIYDLTEKAGEYRINKDYKNAINTYIEIYKQRENYTPPFRAISEMVELTNNYDHKSAIAMFEKAVENKKDGIDNIGISAEILSERLGMMYEHIDKMEEMESPPPLTTTAIPLLPEKEAEAVPTGESPTGEDSIIKAEERYKKALMESGNTNSSAFRGLVRIYLKQEKRDEIFKLYKTAANDCPSCVLKVYDEIVTELKKKELIRELERFYDYATQLEIDNPAYSKALGDDCYDIHRYEWAIVNYERVIKSQDAEPSTYKKLIRAYLNEDHLVNAKNLYIESITKSDDNIYMLKDIVRELKAQEKNREIAGFCENVARLKPKSHQVYVYWGVSLSKMGPRYYAEAVQKYEKAIQMAPDEAETYNKLAVVLGRMGHFQEAKKAYEQALLINPDYYISQTNLAELRLITREYNKTITMVKRLLKKPKASANHQLALRFVWTASLFLKGNTPEAYTEFNKLARYYRRLKKSTNTIYEYNLSRRFLQGRMGETGLNNRESRFLLKLIDALESNRKEGEIILQQLAASVPNL
jgi:tetratricopeptide (TPR) repeat protein